MNKKLDIYKQAKNMEKANCDLNDTELFVTLADYKKLEHQLQAYKDKEDKLREILPLDLAIYFHETYERLAPSFGYETREETRQFDENSNNGKLMIAVCEEILSIIGGE